MFSSITMALSSSSPVPSARPPSDMMLSVRSPMPIITNVASTASGIDTPMMNVLRNERRKMSTTSMARHAPTSAAPFTDVERVADEARLVERDLYLMSCGM